MHQILELWTFETTKAGIETAKPASSPQVLFASPIVPDDENLRRMRCKAKMLNVRVHLKLAYPDSFSRENWSCKIKIMSFSCK